MREIHAHCENVLCRYIVKLSRKPPSFGVLQIEQPDCEFLRFLFDFSQRLLGSLALGHIASDRSSPNNTAFAVSNEAHPNGNIEALTILVQPDSFEILDTLPGLNLFQVFSKFLPPVCGND